MMVGKNISCVYIDCASIIFFRLMHLSLLMREYRMRRKLASSFSKGKGVNLHKCYVIYMREIYSDPTCMR